MVEPLDLDGTSDAAENTLILGTAGNDMLIAEGEESATLKGLAGDDTLIANIADDSLFGGAGDDLLHGDLGDDFLAGGQGVDKLQGGSGGDILFGGAGADALYGGGGRDILYGEGDADELYGGGGGDRLYGDQGDDVVRGGGGVDHLQASEGNDTLKGGKDSDAFIFNRTLATADADTILDFKPGEDTIYLLKVDLPLGEPVPDDVFVASATGDAVDGDDRLLYETDAGKFFYDADGSGAAEKILIAIIGTDTHPALTAADIRINDFFYTT